MGCTDHSGKECDCPGNIHLKIYFVFFKYHDYIKTHHCCKAIHPTYPSNPPLHYNISFCPNRMYYCRIESVCLGHILNFSIPLIEIRLEQIENLPQSISSNIFLQSTKPSQRFSNGTHLVSQLKVFPGHFKRLFTGRHWYTLDNRSKFLQYSVLIAHNPPQPKNLI